MRRFAVSLEINGSEVAVYLVEAEDEELAKFEALEAAKRERSAHLDDESLAFVVQPIEN